MTELKNCFIGTAETGRMIAIEDVQHKPSFTETSFISASGAVRTQFGNTVRAEYACKIDGRRFEDVDFLRYYRYAKLPVWFIDPVAYQSNALPYHWAECGKKFVKKFAPTIGSQYNLKFAPSFPDGGVSASGVRFNDAWSSSSNIRIPNFKGHPVSISAWVDGSSTASITETIHGITSIAVPSTSTSQIRISIPKTTTTSQYLSLKFNNIKGIAGFQVNWGTTVPRKFTSGLATDSGIISDIALDHFTSAQGTIYTPCSFTILEANNI